MSGTTARDDSTGLSLGGKALAVLMNIVLVVGLCPSWAYAQSPDAEDAAAATADATADVVPAATTEIVTADASSTVIAEATNAATMEAAPAAAAPAAALQAAQSEALETAQTAELQAAEPQNVPASQEPSLSTQEGEATAVAAIGSTNYNTLEEAIAAAAEAGKKTTIKLLANVEGGIVIPSGAIITLDLNGHELKSSKSTAASNGGATIYNQGTFTLISLVATGKLVSTDNFAICTGDNSKTTIGQSGANNAKNNNFEIDSVEGAVITSKHTGATITVNAGVLNASDNAVVAGNGSEGYGGNTINIAGGTFNGSITSKGYVACGIYAPNNDTVTVSKGTFNITGGAGIVARAGNVKVKGGTFNCTDNTTTVENGVGKVGDSRVVVPCSALVFDAEANYPALTGDSKISVENGTFICDGGAAALTVLPSSATERISVSGGTFAPEPNEAFLVEGKLKVANGDDSFTVLGSESGTVKFLTKTASGVAGNTKPYAQYLRINDVAATDAQLESVTWASSDPNVVEVDEKGVMTFKAAGTATVTAVYGGRDDLKAEVAVTVKDAVVKHTSPEGVVTYNSSFNYQLAEGTTQLLADVSAAMITPGKGVSNMTLDLNGHTVALSSSMGVNLSTNGSESAHKVLSLVDTSESGGGKLTCDKSVEGIIYCTGNYNDIVIGPGVTVSGGQGVVIFGENNSLTVTGTIEASGDYGISTNGNKTKDATITIGEGASVTAATAALFLPGSGTTTISGGTITGAVAVYQKSGTLNITGGTLKATGDKADFTHNGNGVNPTGDALVVENCSYPGGVPQVTITGGAFISQNNSAVASYAYGEGNEPVEGFITGGIFSSDPTDHLAAGYAAAPNDDKATQADCPHQVKKSLADAEVAVDAQTYTGEALATTGAVTLGGEALGTDDYFLEYYTRSGEEDEYQYTKVDPEDVVNAGEYWVKVVASDTSADYAGASSGYFKFTVSPIELKDLDLTVNSPVVEQDKSLEAVVEATSSEGPQPEAGTDFTISYSVDVNDSNAGTLEDDKPSTAGNYIVTVTGMGNFAGSVKLGFVVSTAAQQIDPDTNISIDASGLLEDAGTEVNNEAGTSTTTSFKIETTQATGTDGSAIATFTEDQSEVEKTALNDTISNIPGNAKATKVYSVDITKIQVTASTDPASTDTPAVKETPVTEGLNRLTLTFPVCADAEKADYEGLRAKITQLHASNFDAKGKAGNVQRIEHTAYVKDCAVTLEKLEQLSNFVIVVEDLTTDELKQAIADAQAADAAVTQTGENAADFSAGSKFVTAADRLKLAVGITQAQAVYDLATGETLPLTQKQIDEATAAMKAATDAFNASVKTGTKPSYERITMYRVYNPYSGEHFYTADVAERDNVVAAGWNDEGIGWVAPSTSGTPVYRLYNPYEPLGDHHYTTSEQEYKNLQSLGWKGEGIGWYSDDAQGTPLYRQYNPNAYPSGLTGAHNYTTSKSENDFLVSVGWQAEGVAWYGLK